MPFTFDMPKLSPTMETGTIAKWHKQVGEYIEIDELVIEIATDKATVEHTALDEGWLRKILVHEGEEVGINEPLAILTETEHEEVGDIPAQNTPSQEPSREQEEEAPPTPTQPTRVQKVAAAPSPQFTPEPPLKKPIPRALKEPAKASPLAKKLAKEKGFDLTSVKGTGPGGRIVARDLEGATRALPALLAPVRSSKHLPGSYEEIPLTQMRKVIGERLQQSKMYIPHFYVQQQVDAVPLTQVQKQFAEFDVKLTVNDFVIRAVALALAHHPEVNSGFHSENHTLIRFQTVDISVAVSTKEGLITPIIRCANEKDIRSISQEMKALVQKAKKGTLQLEEFKGGSFTVSNLGMFGISDFQAIINPPQAAILAVSGIEETPVIKEGKVTTGKVMRLTLSADHRVIDGVEGAKFMKTLQSLLENASLLVASF